MKPECAMCGSRHELYQAHVFETNTSASNTRAASNNASNRTGNKRPALQADANRMAEPGDGDRQGDVGVKKKQRWSREAYNAYQREYMRKKRGNPTIHD